MGFLWRSWQSFYDHAYLLLLVTTAFWGGNAIAGRLAVGQVSPMALTALRWLIVLAVLLPIAGRDLVRSWPELKPFAFKIVWMAFFGLTGFNALFYVAAHSTGAANIAIFQGIIPVVAMLGGLVLHGVPITGRQIAGLLIALAGVAIVGVKGDFSTLGARSFNVGDIWMLIAVVFYGFYTLGLRHRPPVRGLVFFTALALVAFATSLPFLAAEIYLGSFQAPTFKGWLIMAYIGLLPSLAGQVLFIRGVELIGPARAGLFVNLVPVFGTLMAAMLPNEPFAAYHIVGLALVLCGIVLAERK